MQHLIVLTFLVITIFTFTSTPTTDARPPSHFVNPYIGHPAWRLWSSNIDVKTDASGSHLRIWILEVAYPHSHTGQAGAHATLGTATADTVDPIVGRAATWLINTGTFPEPSIVFANAKVTGAHHLNAFTYGWVSIDGSIVACHSAP